MHIGPQRLYLNRNSVEIKNTSTNRTGFVYLSLYINSEGNNMEYLVVCEIEVDANSEEEAAEEAIESFKSLITEGSLYVEVKKL